MGNQATINSAFRHSGLLDVDQDLLSLHCLPPSPESVQGDLGFSVDGTSPWSLWPSLVHPSKPFRRSSKFLLGNRAGLVGVYTLAIPSMNYCSNLSTLKQILNKQTARYRSANAKLNNYHPLRAASPALLGKSSFLSAHFRSQQGQTPCNHCYGCAA